MNEMRFLKVLSLGFEFWLFWCFEGAPTFVDPYANLKIYGIKL
jgi:hypothetical protein